MCENNDNTFIFENLTSLLLNFEKNFSPWPTDHAQTEANCQQLEEWSLMCK